jgi:hypothetical protein
VLTWLSGSDPGMAKVTAEALTPWLSAMSAGKSKTQYSSYSVLAALTLCCAHACATGFVGILVVLQARGFLLMLMKVSRALTAAGGAQVNHTAFEMILPLN